MGIKRIIALTCLAALVLGTFTGIGLAQDVRTLTLGSLRLWSGEEAWLGSLSPEYFAPLGYGPASEPLLKEPTLIRLRQPLLSELAVSGPQAQDNLSFNLNQRVGRVFNLSVALSNIKQFQTGSSSGIKAMSAKAGAASPRPDSGWNDLWALDVGLDYRDPSGHGVHLGFLHGADPLTREVDTAQPDKQGVDLAYSYDLDGIYVNLGYVYSFSPLWNSGPEQTSDSAFYLRFQLHF